MKKIIAVVLIFAVILTVSACKNETYTDAEKFAARANLTIDRNIWSYQPDAVSYTFSSIEYYEEGSARVIRADCAFLVGTGVEVVRGVFLLSDRQDYLVRYNNRNDTDFKITEDTYTELWYINLGEDYSFETIEDNFIDRIKAGDLVRQYRNTKNKSFLGME